MPRRRRDYPRIGRLGTNMNAPAANTKMQKSKSHKNKCSRHFLKQQEVKFMRPRKVKAERIKIAPEIFCAGARLFAEKPESEALLSTA